MQYNAIFVYYNALAEFRYLTNDQKVVRSTADLTVDYYLNRRMSADSKPIRHITNNKVNSAFHYFGVGQSSNRLSGWN